MHFDLIDNLWITLKDISAVPGGEFQLTAITALTLSLATK